MAPVGLVEEGALVEGLVPGEAAGLGAPVHAPRRLQAAVQQERTVQHR